MKRKKNKQVKDFTIGEYLKYLREEQQLTIRQLAERISCATSTVWRYEHEHFYPSYKRTSVLAKYFGVNAEDILGRTKHYGRS